MLKNLASKLPGIRKLSADRAALIQERDDLLHRIDWMKRKQGEVPAGHFYSPVPDFDDLRATAPSSLNPVDFELAAVDLNENEQLELLDDLSRFYLQMPFEATRKEGLLYYFENPAFSYADAILLHCMIRHHRPKRIIEVGSGFSSCMMLDTNELFFGGEIDLTFIEPYPDLLTSLVKTGKPESINLIQSPLQEVDLIVFESLSANDILFIDSTHVSKFGSDVNQLFFKILPKLNPGVLIHFHDIIYPFEYPPHWILKGRAWNEAYLLRAFLQYNNAYRIALMNTYLLQQHRTFFEQKMPLCLQNTGGGIWLKKQI